MFILLIYAFASSIEPNFFIRPTRPFSLLRNDTDPSVFFERSYQRNFSTGVLPIDCSSFSSSSPSVSSPGKEIPLLSKSCVTHTPIVHTVAVPLIPFHIFDSFGYLYNIFSISSGVLLFIIFSRTFGIFVDSIALSSIAGFAAYFFTISSTWD